MRSSSILGSLMVLALSVVATADETSFRDQLPTYWHDAADHANVDPLMLYAIALTEAQIRTSRTTVAPHAWTLRSSQGPQYFDDLHTAKQALHEQTVNQQSRQIDVGMMQISLHWHGHRVNDPAQLLDPETAVRTAGEILRDAGYTASSTRQQVGRYHNWVDVERSDRYADRVLSIYERLVALEPMHTADIAGRAE